MGIQEKLPVAFGRVLRRLRLAADKTQEQLGFDAELRRTYVSILELGQQVPSLITVIKIAAALGIPTADLVAQVEKEMKRHR